MVLVELPYGQTDCDQDIQIDLNKMWKELRRIGKDNCTYVFFTTTKYGYKLIESNPVWFRYDLVWEKHNSVGFLSANKMPLRSHEMIYIFNSPNETLHDLLIERNLEMREYAKIYQGNNKEAVQLQQLVRSATEDIQEQRKIKIYMRQQRKGQKKLWLTWLYVTADNVNDTITYTTTLPI